MVPTLPLQMAKVQIAPAHILVRPGIYTPASRPRLVQVVEIARQRLVGDMATTVASFISLQLGRTSGFKEALQPAHVRPSKISPLIVAPLRLAEVARLAPRLARQALPMANQADVVEEGPVRPNVEDGPAYPLPAWQVTSRRPSFIVPLV